MSYKFFDITRISLMVSLLILLLPSSMLPEINVKGFIDSYHAARLKSPNDFLSSRNRLRLEMFIEKGNALIFASINAMKHHTLPDQTGIKLREAWMEYTAESWDLRIGRQIIVWGKADGIQITDVISPMDYTEFLARDYDDLRMPVDAVKFRILSKIFNVELIWVPTFQSAVIPDSDNPWGFNQNFPEHVTVIKEDAIIPKSTLENSEFGGKLSFYLKGIDFAVSAMHIWDKFPALHKEYITSDQLLVRREHHRVTFLGLDFSLPLGDYVLRGESAYFIGKPLETSDVGLIKKNVLKWLIGLDWFPGGDWNLSAQITGTKIHGYEEVLTDRSHTLFATVSCTKKLFREILTLSTFAYIGINRGDLFNRCSVEYALTDELHLSIGVDLFLGSKGMFGQYQDNSEVWIKARYSF
jgi:hypothetical protein